MNVILRRPYEFVKQPDKHGPNHLKVTGDLNLHGVTKPLTLDVTVVKIGINARSNLPNIGFDASTVLKRSDFGISAFIPLVSDEIQIHITSEAVEKKAYEESLKAEAAEEAAKAAAAKDTQKKSR